MHDKPLGESTTIAVTPLFWQTQPYRPCQRNSVTLGKHVSNPVMCFSTPRPATQPAWGDLIVVFAHRPTTPRASTTYRIPRPAAVLGAGAAELVQAREQPDELLRHDPSTGRCLAVLEHANEQDRWGWLGL